RLKTFLFRRGALDEAGDLQIASEVKDTIQRAVQEAEEHPAKPPLETLFQGVYAEPLWQQREQLEELRRAVAGDRRVTDPRGK
ncbi:MAG TPA: thiamine pyrophosphate-dependent dehydrogenase E1 component subunit alpha, partial [Anaeromyxobacteraceae bacterium]